MSPRSWSSLRAVALVIASLCAASHAAGSDENLPAHDVCLAPAELGAFNAGLPKTRALLASGRALKIVALGSSSTAGAGASASRFNYPSRLAAELARRNPQATIEILNRGINGEDAPENLARLDQDVIADRPDLVIWQTGTNAILREADVDEFDRSVQNGIDRMRQAGIEIVLMDPQYAPRVNQFADHLRTIEQLDAIGRRNRVPVFHRYAVMKYWAGTQSVPPSIHPANMISPDGLHMNDTSYGCVAQRLADAIVDVRVGAREPASAAPAMRGGVLDRKQ